MTDDIANYGRLSPWQPDQLAGFRVGDMVRLPSMTDALEVVALRPPSSLVLRTPTGKQVTAGWRAVSRAHLKTVSTKWSKSND